ncbi:MAG: alpha/beta hydrolase family protein [Chthoniobacter sp.]|uniref:alpha/beta hydrolase family protein n=1 Tax=Chthoniobacter sp. TaxID=2510640 RepID=UPI0032ABE97B
MFHPKLSVAVLALLAMAPWLNAQTPKKEPREFLPAPFDQYCARRVAELSSADWQKGITAENWPAKQAEMRQQLQRMLGLDPWPTRGDLHPVITGTVNGDGFVVEKLQFQSLPGLYVTGDLYRPKEVTHPLPTILYVCGHASVIEDGVSMGNKTAYQHHGVWFARHGYVCLVIDTIELGEIHGEHHGTYKEGRWWWPARGYTPAGVEAWNGIRALDYLETRPEVERTKFGVTGRSGGGAYSWYIAALDERIKVAAPTAGITTLRNHILDGAIEGHCDCMFMVNTERWDFDRVAALVAPRPLLILNSDKDPIFPLDGVMDIYNRTRALYRTLGHEENIGTHIAEGPHKDTQQLNFGAFNWIDRFLQGAKREDLIDEPARPAFKPGELKVFAELPKDEKVTAIDQSFVPAFTAPTEPPTAAEWPQLRDGWMQALRHDCFRAWPSDAVKPPAITPTESTAEGLRLTKVDFHSEADIPLTLWLLHRVDVKPEDLELVVLNTLSDEGSEEFRALAATAFGSQFPGVKPDASAFAEEHKMLVGTKWAMAYFSPRGTGLTSWSALSLVKQTQLRRRLLLLGESLESGQVWDITRAAAALRTVPGFAKTPLWIQARKTMAANALYASLFIPDVRRLDLHALPASQHNGPIYLNVLRHLDLPQAVALAAEHSTVAIYTDDGAPWEYAKSVAAALNLDDKRVQIREPLDAVAK